jgi:hypothetical protein
MMAVQDEDMQLSIARLSWTAVKPSLSFTGPSEVVRTRQSGRTTDDLRLEGDDPVRDGFKLFPDQKMVAVYKGYDRVGCFLNALDQIGIEVELALVESGQFDHDTRLPK